MKNSWGRELTVSVVMILASWVLPGCDATPEMSEDDTIVSADNESAGEGADSASVARANIEETSPAWPAGWLVIQHEEWIPVLDDLGRRLQTARVAFQDGDRGRTTIEIRRGIAFLASQVSDASDRDRAALESAISTLEAITQRLDGDGEVTLEQLDIAFTNAYRSDLEREALVIESGSTVPFLERPERHLELAIEHFLANGQEAEAAREIERASAFLRLEGNRRDLTERALLIESAQDLERLAARVRIFELSDRAELDRVFGPVRHRWHQITQASTHPPTLGLMSH